MTEKQTVAGAYAKIDSHEDLCAERYLRIHELINDLKLGARWIIGLLATVALGLIGWLGVQVYDLNRQAVRPEPVASVASGPEASSPVPNRSVDA
jgi:hypothetical protein